MRNIKFRWLVFYLVGLLWGDSALGDSAWWEICFSCQSENDFRVAALSSIGEDQLVFVSNPATLETRKYDKFSTLEDFGGGMVRMTHILEAPFPAQEQAAFRDALEKSQVVFTTFDSDLVNAYAGLPFYPSALFSVRNGRLGNTFFFGLQASISTRGLLPTRQSVGIEASINIEGVGGGGIGSNDSIRMVPLSIRVQFPDGSHINAVYNPDGTWSDVSVVDVDGNSFDIDAASSLNPVIPDSVIGEFRFGGSGVGDAVRDFIQALGFSDSPGGEGGCRWTELPDGTLELSCSRS